MIASRWLPLSGIVFVVLIVVGVVAISGETPGSDASGAEVASFYDDEAVRQGIASFVLAATAPFLLLFAASVAAFAWPAETTPRFIWRGLLLGGSYMLGTIVMIMALIHFSLVDGAEQEISPNALQALNSLDGNFWVAANAALGVMMLGAAGWLLGRVGVYNVLGWAALVLGIALFIPVADFFALLLSLVWIIVASIALYRERRGDPVAEAAVT